MQNGIKLKVNVNMILSEAVKILERNGFILEDAFERVTPEHLEKVRTRVQDHIDRVKYFYRQMKENGIIPPEYDNTAEVEKHDADKLYPNNLKKQAMRYCYSKEERTPEIMGIINSVVYPHVRHNPHHPDYWKHSKQDCSAMPMQYIYEMMADFAATGEERGTSLDGWLMSTITNFGGTRWKFNDEQATVMAQCAAFLKTKMEASQKRDYGFKASH